jgi:hypothetical protein
MNFSPFVVAATLHRPDGGKPTRFPIFFVGIVDRRGDSRLKGDNPTECFSQVLLWDQQGDDP